MNDMEFKELQPIITLISEQEERVTKKIDEVHQVVRETRDELKQINGRVRKAENDISGIKGTCSVRSQLIDKAVEDLKPIRNMGNIVKWINNNPKLFIFLLMIFLVGIQTFIMLAIENQWLGKLIDKI